MLIYDDFSKKCDIQKLLFCFFESYLLCVLSFKSINSSSLSRKKYDGDNFTSIPLQPLGGQNTSTGIGLTELTEPTDAFDYKS